MAFMDQFQPQPQQTQRIPLLDRISAVRQLAQGNPSALLSNLMQTNPRFAQFVAQNGGKTPEQAFADNGLDYSQIRQLM